MQAVGRKEHLQVECKLYTGSIGSPTVTKLLGVISSDKSNKGAVVTNSRFTSPAKQFAQENPRIELIDGDSLIPLMNEHIGPRWPLQINRLVAEAKGELKSKRKDKNLR